jgi:hypothetical protein
MVTYNSSVSCLIRYQITNRVPRQPGRPLSSAANTQLSGSLSKSEHYLAVPAERVQSVLQLVQGLRRQRLLAPQLVEALAEELVPARHLRRKVAAALRGAAAEEAPVNEARDVGGADGVEVDGPRVLAPRRRHALAQLRRRRHHSARRARGCMRVMRVMRVNMPAGRVRPVLSIMHVSVPQLTPRPPDRDRAQPGPKAFEQIRPDALPLDRLPRTLLLSSRGPVTRPAARLHLIALDTRDALRDAPAWQTRVVAARVHAEARLRRGRRFRHKERWVEHVHQWRGRGGGGRGGGG